ncbi:M6 family metalloprotease domain-containing protein [uncultured Fibrobacter sp.]|uniref:M6 family metalloprotease domain-containing protein n=1 Tax=uncultured Fibrobacter sp. TaxID=261512 RepID=UPI0025FD6909|nr:M6 family metalloprotease domain-containing protein [uncultured Fibrobacter sp.]
MKKVLFVYIMVAACTLVSQVNARPAAPGFQTISNKDGSSVSIRHFGDEHYHYAETSDGYLVMGNGDGSYVYVGEDGLASKVVAKNVADRTPEEKSFLSSLNQEAVRQKHQELNGDRFPEEEGLNENENFSHVPLMSYNQDGESAMMHRRPTSEKWTTGERWFPVLLIGTTDKNYGDSAAFYDFLNKPGYNVNNNIGSLRDYFLYVSDSLFNPHFDVYPIQLNKALTDYGIGDNFKEGQFTAEGLTELAKRADFQANAKKYCMRNSNVDGFIFLFPGMEEDALKQSEIFWGHQFWMQSNGSSSGWYPSAYKAGGYTFDKYLFIAQYADGSRNSKINKMGIFAHEFSHVMGLNDHYGKDANKQQVNGPGAYDIMSLGMYNGTSYNEGNAPMGYSAYEKEIMGWLKLTELEADQVYSLRKLSEMQAYSVTNPNQNDEYYIVEYRPAESYDSYIKNSISWNQRGNGVYVWYIDYDKTICVTNNNANGDVDHQRVALKSVLAAKGYYADFTYVNKNGTSSVPGVYNIVLDGNDRACFTTSQEISLTACPEESSSSVASSSSEINSSDTEVESSSSEESSSSQDDAESSSSEMLEPGLSSTVTGIVSVVAAPQVQFSLEGRQLHVQTDVAGLKELRLFDLQGHLLHSEKFSGNSTSLEIGKFSRGKYIVRLSVGDKLVAVKRI